MTLLKWIIGYGLGYRYFRCLWWIFGFTMLGAVLVHFWGYNIIGGQRIKLADGGIYSLAKLLPLVQLGEFKGVTLSSPVKWYFYFHQLAGYVLAGFLAAGLAGLTQKS
jgi:hypothetical protein